VSHARERPDIYKTFVLIVFRTETVEDGKAITLARDIEIPKKTKQGPVEEPAIDGTATNGVIGKRKRAAEETALNGEPDAKRLAATNGTGNEPIVLDDPDTGAILIDDD
jgi:ubiquitin-like 1-activating enzyme E1 B